MTTKGYATLVCNDEEGGMRHWESNDEEGRGKSCE